MLDSIAILVVLLYLLFVVLFFKGRAFPDLDYKEDVNNLPHKKSDSEENSI